MPDVGRAGGRIHGFGKDAAGAAKQNRAGRARWRFKKTSPGSGHVLQSGSMTPINEFLLQHKLRIAQNPCVSPDFCLDWEALAAKLKAGGAGTREMGQERL